MSQQCPRFRAQAQTSFVASIGFVFSTSLIWLRSAAVMHPTHWLRFFTPTGHIRLALLFQKTKRKRGHCEVASTLPQTSHHMSQQCPHFRAQAQTFFFAPNWPRTFHLPSLASKRSLPASHPLASFFQIRQIPKPPYPEESESIIKALDA